MKKSLIILAFVFVSLNGFSQLGGLFSSGVAKGAYQTEMKRFGIGAELRYDLPSNFRLAPDLMFFFPKNHTTGFDINVNAHYLLNLSDNSFALYPLAGINMSNNRTSFGGESWGNTDFGFNIGIGGEYNLDAKSFLSAEFRYTFNDWDYAQFSVGYGLRF